MALLFSLLAGLFVALSNLFMRKSIDTGGTTKAFLVFQMGTAFLISFLLNPLKTGNYSVNAPILVLAAVCGVVLAWMIYALGRALESGPPGFTFAVLSSATVMPGIVMAALFGVAFGFPYTIWHAIGSVIVIAGLFWAGKGLQGLNNFKRWVGFSVLMFCLHTTILSLYQWRSLLLNAPNPETINSYFDADRIQSPWFTPFMYLVSCLIQLAIFLKAEGRRPKGMEIFYGFLGGTANALCTYFLILATEAALPLENAVIFPIFSVMSIVLSNLWGQKLYQERVNWKACQVSALGLMIGTVDWKAIAAFIKS